MAAQRFRCTDTRSDRYARVTIEDVEGELARVCAYHALAAFECLARARVVWDDTRGINEHETIALRIAEQRSQLSWADAAA